MNQDSKQTETTDEGSIGLSAGFRKYSEEREKSHNTKGTKKPMSSNELLDNFLNIYSQCHQPSNKPTLKLGEPKENIWGDDEARDEIYQLG
jgi:hypothetical protein